MRGYLPAGTCVLGLVVAVLVPQMGVSASASSSDSAGLSQSSASSKALRHISPQSEEPGPPDAWISTAMSGASSSTVFDNQIDNFAQSNMRLSSETSSTMFANHGRGLNMLSGPTFIDNSQSEEKANPESSLYLFRMMSMYGSFGASALQSLGGLGGYLGSGFGAILSIPVAETLWDKYQKQIGEWIEIDFRTLGTEEVQFEQGNVEDLCRATLVKMNEMKALQEAKSEVEKKDCITGKDTEFPDKDCYPGNGDPNEGDESPRYKAIQLTLGGDWATDPRFTKSVHQHPYWCNVVQDPFHAKNIVVPTETEATLQEPEGRIVDRSIQDATKKALDTIMNHHETNSMWNMKPGAHTPSEEKLDEMSEKIRSDYKHMQLISNSIKTIRERKTVRNPISRAVKMMRDSFCDKDRDPTYTKSLVATAFHDYWKMQLRTMVNEVQFATLTKRTSDGKYPFRFKWNQDEKKFIADSDKVSGRLTDSHDESKSEGEYTWSKFISIFMTTADMEDGSHDQISSELWDECEVLVDRRSLTRSNSYTSDTDRALQPQMEPEGKYKSQKAADKARKKQKEQQNLRSPEIKCMDGDNHNHAICDEMVADGKAGNAPICRSFISNSKEKSIICVSKVQFDIMMQIKVLDEKTPPELVKFVRGNDFTQDGLKAELQRAKTDKIRLILKSLGPKCAFGDCKKACDKIEDFKSPDMSAEQFDQEVRDLVLDVRCQTEWKNPDDATHNKGDMNLKRLIEKLEISRLNNYYIKKP